MTDDLLIRAALRRVNTAYRTGCHHIATPQDWGFVLDEHPDKPALDEVAAWYPQEVQR